MKVKRIGLKIAAFCLFAVLAVSASPLFGAAGVFRAARADGLRSVQFVPNAVADFNKLRASDYKDYVAYGPNAGDVSYIWNGTQVYFILNEGLDISDFKGVGADKSADTALDFWIFTTKPQSKFSGGNEIEVASNVDQHDTNEYYWPGSHVFWEPAYQAGAWNHIQLRISDRHGTGIDLHDLRWFRFYYLGIIDGASDEPVLISNVKITETTRWKDDAGAGWVVETKAASGGSFGGTQMPVGKREGETVTLPDCPATDITGETIPQSRISVTVTGPYGYAVTGRTVTLLDGGGAYTVTYETRNALGAPFSKSFTMDVAADAVDTAPPRVIKRDACPADFMTGGTYRIADAVLKESDWFAVTDNRGPAQADVTAVLYDAARTAIGRYEGKADQFVLDFSPVKRETHTLEIAARDAAGNAANAVYPLKTYAPANEALSIPFFDFASSSFAGTGKHRLVDARPSAGRGKSIEFNYKGGATNTVDNMAFFQELRFINDDAPDFFSTIDLRWACIKMWVYIDRAYANDAAWMPADGTGFGNMGLGFAAQNGIYNIPAMEYPVNDMRLGEGWTELTIKMGRTFRGTFNYGAMCEFYVYTNFGGARRMLFNDIRVVESNEFAEGLASVSWSTGFFKTGRTEAVGASSDPEVYNTEEVKLKSAYYMYTPVKLPGIMATDYTGEKDYISEPDIEIIDPDGVKTESLFFTPMCEGEHTAVYTATDYYGHPLSLTVKFNVYGPNDPPQILLGGVDNLRFTEPRIRKARAEKAHSQGQRQEN
ncbi:hypothetical protein FACS1894211_00730 [Clostridia bacterium]|nr:hypothetical protein FACS1894211_00730 [Clostridia bacterium]